MILIKFHRTPLDQLFNRSVDRRALLTDSHCFPPENWCKRFTIKQPGHYLLCYKAKAFRNSIIVTSITTIGVPVELLAFMLRSARAGRNYFAGHGHRVSRQILLRTSKRMSVYVASFYSCRSRFGYRASVTSLFTPKTVRRTLGCEISP
jgi:hypothetical protein